MFGRFRIRVRRRWLVAGFAGSSAALLFFLFPRERHASLELVALSPDGRFHESVSIPRVWVDTTGLLTGAVVRVPLVLAVRNSGGEAAHPARLELSLPTRYRLATGGRPLFGRLTPGSPLVRYELNTPLPEVEPGRLPTLLPKLDTLWLEPIIPAFYCVALADSVPDFVPAPPAPVEAIATVRIFYSFSGGEVERRQTGLLTVQLDPVLLKQEAPEPPPVYRAEYREPEMPIPYFYALQYAGSRQAFCGEPEDPMELLSTLWETPDGGRFFVLDHGGAPRKYLFDLNRDSIIELEMWDPDGDGHFEGRRAAHLPIPSFLMPPARPQFYSVAYLDSLPPDSVLRFDRYAQALIEPYTPETEPPDTTSRVRFFRPHTLIGEDDEDLPPGYTQRFYTPMSRETPDQARRRPIRHRQPPRSPSASPRGQAPGAMPDPRRAPLGRPAPGQADPGSADRPAPRPQPTLPALPLPVEPRIREPEQPSPARREPKLLGRPVDSIRPRPPRPDTTGPPR